MTHRDLQRKSPIRAEVKANGLRESLDAVKKMRMELGTTPIEFAAEHIEDARPELIEAMKCLDDSEHRELHVRLGEIVNQIDGLRVVMTEWGVG